MSNRKYKGRFFENFMIIYDLRQNGKVRHKLIDILFIAVTEMLCGVTNGMILKNGPLKEKTG